MRYSDKFSIEPIFTGDYFNYHTSFFVENYRVVSSPDNVSHFFGSFTECENFINQYKSKN